MDHPDYPDYPLNFVEEHVIESLLGEFAPATYTPEQFDELDRLTHAWAEDHKRQAKAPQKGQELAALEIIGQRKIRARGEPLEMTLDLILVAVDRDLHFGFGEPALFSRVRSDGSRCGGLTASDDLCDYWLWRENEEVRPSGVVDE